MSTSGVSDINVSDTNQEDKEDEDLELDWEEWDPSQLSFTDHMLAGSFAGLAEHVSIFPMDTLKTNMQCDRCENRTINHPFKAAKYAKQIVKKSGLLRLWRGVGAMFAGCIPAHACYFSLFEIMKKSLGADKEGHYPLRAAACGASATFVHDLMMTPFDVIKQRMQLGYHNGVVDCAKSIVRTEGLRAFYLSFPTTVTMNIPYGCVMVAVNESTRKVILDFLHPSAIKHNRSQCGTHSRSQRLTASLFSGCVAGAVAALVTTPLDVVKTRLQTQNLVSKTLGGVTPPLACPGFKETRRNIVSAVPPSCAPGTCAANDATISQFSSSVESFVVAQRYRSMGQTFRSILKEEGSLALLSGAIPRILVHSPSVAISWTAYEFAKSILAGH